MALSDLRAAWKTILEGIPNVGRVKDHEPFVATLAEFLAAFTPVGQTLVNCWTIARERTDEVFEAMGSTLQTHVLVFRHYRGVALVGASETNFQDFVETVRARMRQEIRSLLGGVATEVGPPQARTVARIEVGDQVLDHAEITVRCTERVTY